MISIHYLRDNKEQAIQRLVKRDLAAQSQIEHVLSLDANRRKAQSNFDELQSEANRLAKEIGACFKEGRKEEAEELKKKSTALKSDINQLQLEMQEAELKLEEALTSIPNLPHDSVPEGHREEDNKVVQDWSGEIQNTSKAHWEIAEELGLIDFEIGNKVTGSGFPFYRAQGAKLQRALVSFFLDEATNAGYTEYQTPLLVNRESAFATGQLPDKDGQMYHIQDDKLFLIPTAEVTLTNIFRNEIIKEEELPLKITGHSQCFRREAGSYGKEVRGLNRLHQFDKVEVVQVVKPDNSYEVLEEMKNYVASLLEKLELPYRVLNLCAGDLGFASAKTYDFEVYSSGQGRWLEVSSVSNFEAFQSTRLKLRIKTSEGKVAAHTLNGSALALPRILAALIEKSYINGKLELPAALKSYL